MSTIFASLLLAMAITADVPKENFSNIRIIPVPRVPEPDTAVLKIAVPKEGQTVERPVWLQFRVDGYALGTASQFDRASEIVETKMGQTVHVIIDDKFYFPINEPALDPFEEGGYYYDMSYKFEVPFRLSDGLHTVRMFPARSFGECLKGENVFAALNFYVGHETDQPLVDFSQPMLTYNEPSDQLYLVESKPILLDFYVSNVELSSDGYKVQVAIDGKASRTVTSWQPFYIVGLKRGKHKIDLTLIDAENKLVPGPFNQVSHTITVH